MCVFSKCLRKLFARCFHVWHVSVEKKKTLSCSQYLIFLSCQVEQIRENSVSAFLTICLFQRTAFLPSLCFLVHFFSFFYNTQVTFALKELIGTFYGSLHLCVCSHRWNHIHRILFGVVLGRNKYNLGKRELNKQEKLNKHWNGLNWNSSKSSYLQSTLKFLQWKNIYTSAQIVTVTESTHQSPKTNDNCCYLVRFMH